MILLLKYLLQAVSGRKLWLRLQKKYGKTNNFTKYVLFPSSDDEYNAWGLFFLISYMRNKNIEKIKAVTTDDAIAESLRRLDSDKIDVITIKKKHMTSLIRLAGLKNMMDFWVILSVKEPYDTGAERLLGKKGITRREIVWYDMFQIRDRLCRANVEKTEISIFDVKFQKFLNKNGI